MRILCAFVVILGLGACGRDDPDAGGPAKGGARGEAGTRYVVSKDPSTPYYRSSPTQGRPPDGELAKGTAVVRLPDAPMGTYWRVHASSGEDAWVDSADLAPAR